MAAPMHDLSIFELSTKCINALRKKTYASATFNEIEEIDFDSFFENHLLPNKPCIFPDSLTSLWKSRHMWVGKDGPAFAHLRQHFGEATVPVANCSQEQFSAQPKQDMTMNDYLEYWQAYIQAGYPDDQPRLYLKDWHCAKAFPDYNAYTTPVYFGSDWLNEFWDTLPQDGYRFVYMGPKGSWTPFHTDVYRSHSWSANICGMKKWIFYPPGCEESLKDSLGNLVYDVSQLDEPVNAEVEKRFPNARNVKDKRLEVIQHQGQTVFVPSGWHHQVYNLEDTISINHNWLNACNIDLCWTHLKSSLVDVKREIADCRDMQGWHQQCQLILNASAGIDFKLFIQMLRVIADNRINYLQGTTSRADSQLETSAGCREHSDSNIYDKKCEKVLACENSVNSRRSGSKPCKHESCTSREWCECKCRNLGDDYLRSEITSNEFHSEKYDLNNTENPCGVDCKVEPPGQKETNSSIHDVCKDSYHCLYKLFNSKAHSKRYLLFDLTRIREIAMDILDNDDYQSLELDYQDSVQHILDKINKCCLLKPLRKPCN